MHSLELRKIVPYLKGEDFFNIFYEFENKNVILNALLRLGQKIREYDWVCAINFMSYVHMPSYKC